MPRGNVPAAAALRVLRGRASKHESETMARPIEEAPPAPGGLSPEGAAEWDRVVPELYARGVFNPALDHSFMVVYCSAWAVYTAALAELASGGIMAEGYRGQVKKSPAHQVSRDAAAMMLTFGARFGLNPLDRQRLSMPEPDSGIDDTFGGLLS